MKDSCRNCGGEFTELKKCPVCFQATQFSCTKCGHVTDEHIHSQCV